MTRIDLHAHVIPDAYRAGLEKILGDRPALPPASVAKLEAVMERYQIEAAVISVGPPGGHVGAPAQAAQLARVANETIAEIVRERPRRFAGLGVLPLPDVETSLTELAYVLDDLALDGVMLLTNAAGIYPGDSRWEPLFAELNRRAAYVFVHPTAPPYAPPLGSDPLWLYEFPFETTRALVTLVYSGTLERYPAIRMQFAHLGGTAPFIAHRLASLAQRMPNDAADAPAGALAYLARQYYDTGLSNNAPGVTATLEMAPIERIVFGTDWPYAALPESGNDPAPGLGFLSSRQRAAVDASNAATLVPRLTGVGAVA